jgi:RHS repeat-associated protein
MQPATATRNHRAAEPTPHCAYQDHARYDQLNRLSSATDYTAAPNGWNQGYGYDQFGNRWVSANGTLSMDPRTPDAQSDINAANNRLTGANYAYDLAGNQTTYGGWTLSYDAENRIKTSQPSGGTQTTYAYDGDGRRVKKTTGSTNTLYIYDVSGQLAAEYGGAAPPETGTHYITTDHLGSTRVVTRQNNTVVSRHDYLPFGEEIPVNYGGRTTAMGYQANLALTHKFTGKERDTETGLDYFGARYMSSPMGRFTSADAPFADQHASAPQSWNLYPYVRNNPLRYVDPTGRCSRDSQGGYWDRDDAGTYMFAGPCSDGKIGEDKELPPDNGDVPLSLVAQSFYNEMSARRDASNQMIGAFAGGSAVAGTGVGIALQASGAGALTTLGNITPNNLVYQSINAAGDVQYVGITANFAQREAAHAARLAIQRIPGLQNLTRAEARAVEQALIENFGLGKNGGTLLNQINSIAASNPIYGNSLKVGIQILKNVGYPGF